MNVVLIGFSHCGKSTIGKLLAKKLQRPFCDTDQMMIKSTAFKTARDLYKEIGKAAFRALEIKAITTLANKDNVIIATGGGAILEPANSTLLKQNAQLIYIANTPDILWQRIEKNGIPAYLKQTVDPKQAFLEMYAKRDPVYKALADHIIDAQGMQPLEVMRILLKLLQHSA